MNELMALTVIWWCGVLWPRVHVTVLIIIVGMVVIIVQMIIPTCRADPLWLMHDVYNCVSRWGQFVTEAGLSVLIFFLGANSKLVSYTPGLRCAAIGRFWPMSGPGVLAPLISGHQPSTRPAVRVGAAISICRETDFIWITLLLLCSYQMVIGQIMGCECEYCIILLVVDWCDHQKLM